jgi:hypothetical protein
MRSFGKLVIALVSVGLLSCHVQSFAPTRLLPTETKLMAGFGATTSSPKNKNKKAKNAPFDVNASLARLEKKYRAMMLASNKQLAKKDEEPRSVSAEEETITSEFVIAARAMSQQGLHDWVPIAQLCVSYPESNYHETEISKEISQAAVSAYCREISLAAGMGAPMFSSVARNEMEYGVEPLDSFFKHVYEKLVEENKEKKTMPKGEARSILGLENETDLDKAKIKQAYRTLSFSLHPDRLGESDDREEAAVRFENVKTAYEMLTQGVREAGKSWYETLGGRARTEFHQINLLSLSDAQVKMEEKRIQGSIMGLDTDLVQSFVARNLRSE